MRKITFLVAFLNMPGVSVWAESIQQIPDSIYHRQWQMVFEVFRAYERGDLEFIKSLIIPEAQEEEISLFKRELDKLIFPDLPLVHHFEFLDETNVYGYGENGLDDLMADAVLCYTVTVQSVSLGIQYQKMYYLFYHFHFDEPGTKFEFLDYPYVKTLHCAP